MGQWSFITKIIKDAKNVGDTKNAKRLVEKAQYLRKQPKTGAELRRLRNLREAFDTEFSGYDPNFAKNTKNYKSAAEKFNAYDDRESYSLYEHGWQKPKEYGGYEPTTIKDLMNYYRDIRDTRQFIKNKDAYNHFVDKDYLNFINAVKEKVKQGVHPRKAAYDAVYEGKNYNKIEPYEKLQYLDKDYIP